MSMIKICHFERKKNLNIFFSHHKDIYAVDSEFDNVWYAADGERFAVVRNDGGVICGMSEVPKLASLLVDEVRNECLEVWEMVRNKRWETNNESDFI